MQDAKCKFNGCAIAAYKWNKFEAKMNELIALESEPILFLFMTICCNKLVRSPVCKLVMVESVKRGMR